MSLSIWPSRFVSAARHAPGHGATEQLRRTNDDAKDASRGPGPTICCAATVTMSPPDVRYPSKQFTKIDRKERGKHWQHVSCDGNKGHAR